MYLTSELSGRNGIGLYGTPELICSIGGMGYLRLTIGQMSFGSWAYDIDNPRVATEVLPGKVSCMSQIEENTG